MAYTLLFTIAMHIKNYTAINKKSPQDLAVIFRFHQAL